MRNRQMMARRLGWCVLLAILAACSGGDPNTVGLPTPYTNTDLGFRVDYPSNWQTVQDPTFLVGEQPSPLHAVLFLRDQAAGVLFTVLVQPLEGEPSLTAYAEQQMTALRSSAGDAVYSDWATAQLGGQDALETHTRLEQNGQTLTQRVLLTVRAARGYAVVLAAPEDSPLITAMEEMLASFSLLP